VLVLIHSREGSDSFKDRWIDRIGEEVQVTTSFCKKLTKPMTLLPASHPQNPEKGLVHLLCTL
jgi:hypothetical protein